MKKIKVPAKVKKTNFDKLTNWFTQSNAETAAALFGTSTSKIIIALDGNGYMVGFGSNKNDGFGDGICGSPPVSYAPLPHSQHTHPPQT